MLAITKDLLGTENHLLQQDPTGPLTWSRSVPPNFLSLGPVRDSISIEAAFEIFKMQCPTPVPEEFQNAMKAIGTNETVIPWHLVIPQEKYLSSLKDTFEILWKLFSKLCQSSYLQTYIRVSNFINCMQKARIDSVKLSNYIAAENNPSVLSTLKSFKSCDDGLTQKVHYSNCRTVTGRLTVRAGPRILTLPANCRDIIGSYYEGGQILELDFKSLEPRIALILAGKDPPCDVYNEISEKLFSNKLKRPEVKIAVLCALYGASTRKLDSMLDNKFSGYEVIKQIKEYFCYNDITTKLSHDYKRDGLISNAFGRPIFCDSDRGNILYSNFVQSTAVDAAILGFKKLLDTMISDLKDVRPLFLVHDALILDIKHNNWMKHDISFVEVDNVGKLYFDQTRVT
jgi:hypothetical protein